MASKNIHINDIDSVNLKAFDAKDDHSFITLKDAPKNWVEDSLLGKTIYVETFQIQEEKAIGFLDTFKQHPYFIFKKIISTSKHTSYEPSIFTHHQLPIQHKDVIFRKHPHTDWSLPFFLLGFALLGVANVYFLKRFNLFVKAFFFRRFVSQLMREDNSQTQRLSLLLTIIYLSSISLFVVKLNDVLSFTQFEMDKSLQILCVMFLILCFFIFKIALNYLVGAIFETEKEISEYTFNLVLINQFLGLGLFLLSFALYFVDDSLTKSLLYWGLALLTITYLYRIVRGVLSVRTNKHISAIYIFLYFCTLEILPVVLLTKLMLDS